VEPDQLEQVEALVNQAIRADLPVATFEEGLEKARQMGARAQFGEKYEERVRVVQAGDFSLELCGGTHVRATGQIGHFVLLSESSIATGTRRAEALTGLAAEQATRRERQVLARLSDLLKVSAGELPERLESLLVRQRELERALDEVRQRRSGDQASELAAAAGTVAGVRVAVGRVEAEDAEALRRMADGLRQSLGSGVGVLGAAVQGKVSFVAVVTDDLIKGRGLKAGDLVRQVAQLAGGSGGGKPHLAQAGGRDPEKLDLALAAVPDLVRRQLAG
jgi:alanyl-tRNA synthetase